MILSITYEHIQDGRNSWSCYENINDGNSIRRQWIHGGCGSYEESLAIARNTRLNYDHLERFRGVSTEHISRSMNESSH